jgi:hypothetical protein
MPWFRHRNCTRKSNAACDAFARLRKPPLVGRTVVQALRSWYVTQPLRFSTYEWSRANVARVLDLPPVVAASRAVGLVDDAL